MQRLRESATDDSGNMKTISPFELEVYDVRFQRGEVGFHVCHLPESS